MQSVPRCEVRAVSLLLILPGCWKQSMHRMPRGKVQRGTVLCTVSCGMPCTRHATAKLKGFTLRTVSTGWHAILHRTAAPHRVSVSRRRAVTVPGG